MSAVPIVREVLLLVVAASIAACSSSSDPSVAADDDGGSGGMGAGGETAVGDGCVLQPEQVSLSLCDDFERLMICDEEPAGCEVAAVADGYCCPPVPETLAGHVLSCRTQSHPAGSYEARLYVRAHGHLGHDGVTQIAYAPLSSAATAIDEPGSWLVSDRLNGVGHTVVDYSGHFTGPDPLFGSMVTDYVVLVYPNDGDVTKACGRVSRPGDVDVACVAAPATTGDELPVYDAAHASDCGLGYGQD